MVCGSAVGQDGIHVLVLFVGCLVAAARGWLAIVVFL